MRKLIIWAILALSLAHSEEKSEDPFGEPGPIHFPRIEGTVTFLTAQEDFGVPEWSLDQWPGVIHWELRVFFRPFDGPTTQLFRIAVGDNSCWIEKRETSPTGGSAWGSVVSREVVKAEVDDTVREIQKLAFQEDLYRATSLEEDTLISNIKDESVWILDFLSDEYRRSIIVHNVEVFDEDYLSNLTIPEGGEIRDFSRYVRIWQSLDDLFEKHAQGGIEAHQTGQ